MKNRLSVCFVCFILVCGCDKQKRMPNIRTLPMDSSLAIIMEATGLLTDSCVPMYWPRDFSTKKVATQYTAYVMQKGPNRLTRVTRPNIRRGLDSSFYALIDYASQVELQKITPNDVRLLSNQLVKIEVTDGLYRNFTDDELGYINVSPVVTNQQLSQAVFFYELSGEIYSSWIVCIRRKKNRWVIVNEKRLAIS
jgi:hypothetical protein